MEILIIIILVIGITRHINRLSFGLIGYIGNLPATIAFPYLVPSCMVVARHVLHIQLLILISNLLLSKPQEDVLLHLAGAPILKENQLLRIVSTRGPPSSFDIVHHLNKALL
jgi:hypothetical protein